MQQLWTVYGVARLGAVVIEKVFICGTLATPFSLAYFDTSSGEIWARREVTKDDGSTAPWTTVHSTHDALAPPHHLLQVYTPLETLPLPLLIREFLLWYSWAERYNRLPLPLNKTLEIL